MRKKRINQILRGLGFNFDTSYRSWSFEDEDNPKPRSRYRHSNGLTVELKRPSITMTKGKGGLDFTINEGYQTIFKKPLAQLTEDEFFSSMTRNFIKVKALRRKDILTDLLDTLTDE